MTRSSLAIITLLDEAPAAPGAPGVPTHPIYWPPGISGGPGQLPPWVMPPIYVVVPPGSVDGTHPEHPIYLPVYPSHPIVIPPGSIADGKPEHPIYIPVYPAHPIAPGGGPTHPIVIPPGAIDGVHPEHPIVLPPVPPGIWGPTDPRPTHPIAPGGGGAGERPKLIEWHVGWSPETGWVIVGEPQFPVPTPSPAKGTLRK